MAKKNYDHLLKLLLIGDSGVGKTCILLRYSDDVYNIFQTQTVGIDFRIKTIEVRGKRIKLQIWDTAGQERFQNITANYYRGAMGIMLVYDITNKTSFDNIARWLRTIQKHAGEDVEKMILGNKCDRDSSRLISRERGEMVARENGVPFLETSAKTNVNVEQAFVDLSEAILDKRQDILEPAGSLPTMRSKSDWSRCGCRK